MADLPDLHEGEPIDGYRASLPAGIKARFWRFHLHDEVWLSAWFFLVVPPLIGMGIFWLGTFLFRTWRIKVMWFGLLACGLGALLVLGGVFFGLLAMWGARFWMKRLPNRQLIPGVITGVKPLRILGLADMGKTEERKGVEFGLRYIEPWHLPTHPHRVGMRIPCVAHYNDEGTDRYYSFAPYPVAYANGDEFDLGHCMARLGEAPFQRLERLIARGSVPDHAEWMILVDRNDEVVEERSSLQGSQMAQAEKAADAGTSES